ncbi:MAG: hypothetical protein RLZ12_1025 [Bacillota bacterium]
MLTNPVPNLYLVNNVNFFKTKLLPALPQIPILYWASFSQALKNASAWKTSYTLYDCVDDFPDWEEDEKKWTHIANLIFCTSWPLLKKLKTSFPGKPVLSVPNGCDWDYFSQVTKRPKINTLAELPVSTGPKILYMGAWAPWVDEEILQALGQQILAGQIIVVGPNLREDKPVFPKNVFFLGHQPYKKLWSYLAYADLAILPFKKNRITHSTNPIKIYEYLAAGKAVVSTSLPEVLALKDHIHLADTPADFCRTVLEAYKDCTKQVLSRSAFAKQESWNNRFALAEKSLVKHLPNFKATPLKINLPNYTAVPHELIYGVVNSNYPDTALVNDPLFVGQAATSRYETYLKLKDPTPIPKNFSSVYLELTGVFVGEIARSRLQLSYSYEPWEKEQLTYANKPLRILWRTLLLDTLDNNTFSIEISPIFKPQISLHLSSTANFAFTMSNPQLLFFTP